MDVREPAGDRAWDYRRLAWDVTAECWRSVGPEDGDRTGFADLLGPERPPLLAYAIEWLDDLPAPVASVDPSAPPVAVGPDGSTAALDTADRQWLARWWPASEPGRAVVGRTRDAAWRWLAQRLPPGSLLVSVDYGHVRAERPVDGGLAAYRDGLRVEPGPGTNVTAGVAVDALAAAVEETGAQRLWCHRLADLPADFWDRTQRAGLAGLAMRSQVQLLRDPRRFGQFWLVAHRIPAPGRP
ncbi:MAG: hypothetical protein Q4F67_03985 [Propionibacteriaceae bacterium]|nr:hypothetical protein [Propionibacteriaceae bacterium]